MKPFDKISVNPEHGTTLAYQLKQQLAWLIATGELKANDLLPPVRDFARQLGINLHTVRNAYKKLELDGLISSKRGIGTMVLPYDPAHFARAARSQNTNLIGVILPSLESPFYHKVLSGIEEIAEQDHSLILLSNSHEDDFAAWRDFSAFASRDVEGILVISHDLSQFIGQPQKDGLGMQGVPFVSVDAPFAPGYSVNLDLRSVGYQAACHLLQLGHHNIGMITYNPQADVIRPILDGFMAAYQESGKVFEEGRVITVPDFSPAAGYEGALALLQQEVRPSAVFVAADTLALGALRAFRQKGLKIPQDIAMVSFDNIPETEFTDPPLTSISAPGIELGRKAMEMLKTLIAEKKPPRTKITLPVQMIVRKSCGGQVSK